MTKNELKQQRLEQANALIKIIGSHGRRFFYSKKRDVYAQLELRNGRVWFIDDYMGTPVYTHKTAYIGMWRGFSHGGTLKSLIEDMRDYVIKGTPVPAWKIVIQRLGGDDLRENVWGYDEASAKAVREAAYALEGILDLPEASPQKKPRI